MRMHNGFLQVESQKMSKSLGNFTTIREVLNDWPGEVARLNMLKTHYRQPIDWTVRGLEESENDLAKWRDAIEKNRLPAMERPMATPSEAIITSLADDLGFSGVLATLHKLSASASRGNENDAAVLLGTLDFLGFGIREFLTRGERDHGAGMESLEQINDLINERLAARRAKNFAESDRIRDELLAMGIQLKDGKDPATGEPTTTWEVKR